MPSNAETNAQPAETVVEQSKKKVLGRGINNATRAVSRLKFTNDNATRENGLFLCHLDSIALADIKIGEDTTGLPSFNGKDIPKLTFTFATNEADETKRKYISQSFNAVESNAKSIPSGDDAWKVNNVITYLKHYLDVYVLKGRNLTEAEEEALQLPFIDFDENNNYVPVDADIVLSGWRTFFEHFLAIMENEGKPYYKSSDGKDLVIWLKLVRFIKTRKNGWKAVNNGELSLPQFTGEGVIELYRQNTKPLIHLNGINETIQFKDVETKKTPNTPNPAFGNGAPGFGGVPIDNGLGGGLGAGTMPFNDPTVNTDMPF